MCRICNSLQQLQRDETSSPGREVVVLARENGWLPETDCDFISFTGNRLALSDEEWSRRVAINHVLLSVAACPCGRH